MTPRALGQELLESTIEKAKRRGPLLRRYTVSRLDDAGREKITEHMAPATLEFENAFNAFPRGTLITTDQGVCAIEDLRPGMKVVTQERGPQEVVWIGSMMIAATSDTPTCFSMTPIARFAAAAPSSPSRYGYDIGAR